MTSCLRMQRVDCYRLSINYRFYSSYISQFLFIPKHKVFPLPALVQGLKFYIYPKLHGLAIPNTLTGLF
jgi:hypothetical protein